MKFKSIVEQRLFKELVAVATTVFRKGFAVWRDVPDKSKTNYCLYVRFIIFVEFMCDQVGHHDWTLVVASHAVDRAINMIPKVRDDV